MDWMLEYFCLFVKWLVLRWIVWVLVLLMFFGVGFMNFKFYVIIRYDIYEVIKGKNFCKRGWCVRISMMS